MVKQKKMTKKAFDALSMDEKENFVENNILWDDLYPDKPGCFDEPDVPTIENAIERYFNNTKLKIEPNCRVAMEKVFERKFLKVRPKWLRNKSGNLLELDGYCEELAIAFEYNGKQHYEFVPYLQRTRDVFERQQDNDTQKRALCALEGVTLITVPYTVKPADFEQFIRDEYTNLTGKPA